MCRGGDRWSQAQAKLYRRSWRDACGRAGACGRAHLHVGVAGSHLEGGHLQVEQAAAQGEALAGLAALVVGELLLHEALGVHDGAHTQEGAPRGAQLQWRVGWGVRGETRGKGRCIPRRCPPYQALPAGDARRAPLLRAGWGDLPAPGGGRRGQPGWGWSPPATEATACAPDCRRRRPIACTRASRAPAVGAGHAGRARSGAATGSLGRGGRTRSGSTPTSGPLLLTAVTAAPLAPLAAWPTEPLLPFSAGAIVSVGVVGGKGLGRR